MDKVDVLIIKMEESERSKFRNRLRYILDLKELLTFSTKDGEVTDGLEVKAVNRELFSELEGRGLFICVVDKNGGTYGYRYREDVSVMQFVFVDSDEEATCLEVAAEGNGISAVVLDVKFDNDESFKHIERSYFKHLTR